MKNQPLKALNNPDIPGVNLADLKVLMVSSEAVPFAKTGGLADVAGSLPPALVRQGVEAALVLPAYRTILESGYSWRPVIGNMPVPLGNAMLPTDVLEGETEEGVRVYLIDREDLFNRPNLYGNRHGDYYDNLERFSFFCHGALRLANALSITPDLLHLHDWQTGLIPALLKGPYWDWPNLTGMPTVFTIHNLGYQGNFGSDRLWVTGLSHSQFYHADGLEYWGSFSLLKSGIVYAHAVTTVSPTYAREIQTDQGGMAMAAVLRSRGGDVRGILNGVDYGIWNPETDPHIETHYTLRDTTGKGRCKAALLRELHLDANLMEAPLLCIISRLDEQKGFDLLLSAIDGIMETGAGLVILGSGKAWISHALSEAQNRFPGRMALRTGFDVNLAHRMIAGSDIFLMPSLYEPCGLTQMYAFKYGTVPVARGTGGLEDTVLSFDPPTREGNGFKFYSYDALDFLQSVQEAVRLYRKRPVWEQLMQNGMKMDFSWDRSAKAYTDIYRSIKH
jgi:starch synthase